MIRVESLESRKSGMERIIHSYLLEPGLELCSGAAMGVWISILNLAVAVTLVTWPAPELGEALREEPVLEPWENYDYRFLKLFSLLRKHLYVEEAE